jgi:hypothetical protein
LKELECVVRTLRPWKSHDAILVRSPGDLDLAIRQRRPKPGETALQQPVLSGIPATFGSNHYQGVTQRVPPRGG